MTKAALLQDLSAIAALNGRVDELDATRGNAFREVAELGRRRQALEERLAEVRASKPVDAGAVLDEPLIEALAADPSCSPDADAIAKAAKRHVALQVLPKDRDDWFALSDGEERITALRDMLRQLPVKRGDGAT